MAGSTGMKYSLLICAQVHPKAQSVLRSLSPSVHLVLSVPSAEVPPLILISFQGFLKSTATLKVCKHSGNLSVGV